MAVESLKPRDLKKILAALPGFLDLPTHKFWVDYDEEADVLYLSFKRPQQATDSRLREDGIIVRKSGREIVGLTILDASKR